MGISELSKGDFLLELSTWAVTSLALHAATSFWAKLVSLFVPEPYLDEVFHIRQAQAYCAGRFSQWDSKITTPPGIYLISWLLHRLGFSCFVDSLRQTNVALLSTLVFNACLHLLLSFSRDPGSRNTDTKAVSKSQATRVLVRKVHTSLNISVFPPLFFFSGLYYTDIASTAFVLVGAWLQYQPQLALCPKLRGVFLILNGIAALFCRQTNVFWIGVFPAALDVVDNLTRLSVSSHDTKSGISDPANVQGIVLRSWRSGILYDLPYESANLEDYFLVVMSIAIVAASRIFLVLRTLTPYLVLIIGFAGFVAWNGSVVLGDKSNHVATLHLPQMLYLWPLILFFSFPLIYPHVLVAVVPSRILPSFLAPYKNYNSQSGRIFYQVVYSFLALCLALLVVHKNTIVHPFTLADNRHYVFYVFRLLLKHPSVRYMVVPVYLISSWAVLRTFRSPTISQSPRLTRKTNQGDEKSSQPTYNKEQVPASYVLIWLATTAMTLITAPLVEPRYFILPWIFWRLRIPGPAVQPITKGSSLTKGGVDHPPAPNPVMTRVRYILEALDHGDHRLYLETAWILLVNAVTGYIFLYWGFEWEQEKGKIQRFMW